MRRILLPLCTRLRSAELRRGCALLRVAELRRGFTMIELLLVIGIIAILASIVIVAINPTKQLSSARDAKRRHEANQLEKALNQFLIDKGVFPTTISEGSSAVKPVCREGQSHTSCLDFYLLTPDYLVTIPLDPTETNSLFSGYKAYLQSGRAQVTSTYLTGTVQIITSGLVGYWKFDETSGTVAADSSGSGNGGTHANGPTISTTVAPTLFTNARSLSFDGTNDYVNIAATNIIPVGSPSYSICTWFNTRDFSGYRVYLRNNAFAGNGQGVAIGVKTGGIAYVDTYNSEWNPYSGFSTNQWYHTCVLSDGATQSYYVNGILRSSRSITSSFVAGVTEIGADTSNVRYFNGSIDDVRIYNRALDSAEITQIATGNG